VAQFFSLTVYILSLLLSSTDKSERQVWCCFVKFNFGFTCNKMLA